MTNQQELINQAWELTKQIEAAAADGDWPRAALLSDDRSPLLMSLQADQPAEALATIRLIQASIDGISIKAAQAQTALNAAYHQSMGKVAAADQFRRALNS